MMRKLLPVILIASVVCGAYAHRQNPQDGQEPQNPPEQREEMQNPQTPQDQRNRQPVNEGFVNLTADFSRQIPVGDSTVIYLLGNVVLYHNGAVITCDSAVRYSNRHMEFFHNVLLNRDSTYIYGDRLDYNGITNLARVFSPLVKMVNGDAVLYTYNLTFNTLDNIGEYFGGGTIRQEQNRLESQRGYYYADTRDFICVDNVQVRSPDYRMISDSITYNLDQEVSTFYTLSYIWNDKDEILRARQGRYYHKTGDYRFVSDSYVLTAKQEIWSDTLEYNSNSGDAILRRDIQIRDDEQKVMAFGDYGQYWGEREDGLLTIDPALVTFDPKEDSLFVRADSMFVFTLPHELDFARYEDEKRTRSGMMSLTEGQKIHGEVFAPSSDSAHMSPGAVSAGLPADAASRGDGRWASSGQIGDLQRMVIADKAEMYAAGDTLSRAMLTSEFYDHLIRSGVSAMDIEGQLLYNEYRARTGEIPDETALATILKEAGFFETILVPQEEPAAAQPENERTTPSGNGKSISEEGDPDSDPLPAEESDESKEIEKLISEKSELTTPTPLPLDSITRNVAWQVPRDSLGMPVIPVDSLGEPLFRIDSLGLPIIVRDSLGEPIIPVDSLGNPIFAVDTQGNAVAPPVEQPKRDSLQRVLRAYRNVRMFRNDFQAVCDSLMGFTRDSTIHMYVNPVLWNNDNQITSEVIDIFTKHRELERAFFTGNPMMVSRVDSVNYNQVKGRTMESFFRDREIYRHDVAGNGEAFYYSMDDDAHEANAFMEVRCANMTFLIRERQLDKMTFRDSPTWNIYPIEKIPSGVGRFLPGFQWLENRRPGRADVFNRTIRPTEREYHENMPKPQFPKTERIEDHKNAMIRNRRWVERNDTVPPHAIEFIRSLEGQ